MNVLGAIKKKYDDVFSQIGRRTRIRKQLNMKVDIRLHGYLKGLTAESGVPRDIVGEHALEIGCYYFGRILENEKLAIILRHHLTMEHLLNTDVEDSEASLSLGEGDGSISNLLARIEPVLRSWRNLQRAFAIATKKGDFAPYEKHKKQLLHSVVTFAEWLEKNYRDEPGSGEANGGFQEEDGEEDEDDDDSGN